MAYCPGCRGEYRAGFTQCAPCGLALVEALPEHQESKAQELRDAVAAGASVAVARSTYTEACQMVEALHQFGVDAMVAADPASCGKGGACSHYLVHTLPEDLDAAKDGLKEQWRRLLDHDGIDVAATEATLDLDAGGELACPACGATFAGGGTECPDCGLFLGDV